MDLKFESKTLVHILYNILCNIFYSDFVWHNEVQILINKNEYALKFHVIICGVSLLAVFGSFQVLVNLSN